LISNVSGRIAYVTLASQSSYAWMSSMNKAINALDQRGAIGIISARTKDERLPGWASYGSVALDFKLPHGSIIKSAFEYSKAYAKTLPPNQTIPIIFYGYDPNPWGHLEDGVGFILWMISLEMLFMFNIVFSGSLLIRWIIAMRGIDLTIGFFCLSLEFLTNTMRFVQIFLWGIHNNFNIPLIDILVTIPFCLTDITTIIITFFWLDLTTDPMYHGKFMGIMKIPATIIILALIGVEISGIIIKINGTDFQAYIMYFYGSILLLVALLNGIAAYLILQPFNKTNETKKKIRRISQRIIGSSVASIGGVVIFFMFSQPENLLRPDQKGSLWWFLYFFFFLQSLLLILIFKVPKTKPVSTSSSNKDATKATKENSE